ncbi:hypothetical protein HK096_003958 [Nowakowskiella sp. JEL0078]|nr:hypothetical protein HK096_003958 [Nowakowskiella sp. JEL0078]
MDFLTKGILSDPTKFFASSASSTAVTPYQLPGPSSSQSLVSSASSSASRLYRDLLDSDQSHDFLAFALQCYIRMLVASPLQVLITLSEAQYQKREVDIYWKNDSSSDVLLPKGMSLRNDQPVATLDGGVWLNIRNLVETEHDGWFLLFKGHLTSFVHNVIFTAIQPTIEEGLNDLFDVYDDSHPATLTISQVIVGGLLSPLELVKTRIIVQQTKKYHSVAGLPTILAEETSLYPLRHLIPSVIIHAVSPLLRSLSIHIITNELGISEQFSPYLFRSMMCGLMMMETLVITPLELARTRIQCLPLKQGSGGFESSVVLSGKYYNGIGNVMVSVISEEGSVGGTSSKKKKTNVPQGDREWTQVDSNVNFGNDFGDPWFENARKLEKARDEKKLSAAGGFWVGVKSLYRGFWPRYVQRLTLYFLKELAEPEKDDFFGIGA